MDEDHTPHALLLTGTGRYADPWHPYPATSAHLVRILQEAGLEVSEREDVDAALAEVADGSLPDLLVANLGRPDELPAGEDEPGAAGLERLIAAVPILALHAAANCFPACDAWERAIGGRWLPQVSWHPEFGSSTVRRAEGAAHPVTAGIEAFCLQDERYLDLRRGENLTVLYEHEDPRGGSAPSIWLRAVPGEPRRAYDALGHDERSYAAPEHRLLIARLALWLLGE